VFKSIALLESDWTDARLDDCLFDGCDLTRMRPSRMAARGVAFVNCRLMGVDWTGLRPNPTLSFERCSLQYGSFVTVNLTATSFAGCKATEVNFFESRLVDADFSGTDLTGSRFEDCDLSGANFAGARGVFVDPAKNKVKNARIGIDTAVLIALSAGFRVAGYDEDR
jgi:fluoroquinolone resistance protein